MVTEVKAPDVLGSTVPAPAATAQITATLTAQSMQWNASQITRRLWVGGGLAGPSEVAWLASQGGITHIISAAAELDDSKYGSGINFLHVPWHDDGTPKPVEDFTRGLGWWLEALDSHLKEFGRLPGLYVHCAAGHNRGPLMATFILAATAGIAADVAFSVIKAQRPVVTAFNQSDYRTSCLAALAAIGG